MIDIQIKMEGADKYFKQLQKMERNNPKVAAYVLNKMGFEARDAAQAQVRKIFKNPTPWVQKKSIEMWPAKANRMRTIVEVSPGARRSLYHHIYGGERPQTRFEKNLQQHGIMPSGYRFAVPAQRMKRDKYGNVTQGQRNKMLSAMGAQTDRHANTTARSVKRNKSQGRIFAVRKGINTPAGIYQSVGSKSDRRLLPMMIFAKSTHYKKRWKFIETTRRAAFQHLPKALRRAYQKYY